MATSVETRCLRPRMPLRERWTVTWYRPFANLQPAPWRRDERTQPLRTTTLRTLIERNASQREIERVTGIDRKTIRSYHQRFAAERSNSSGVTTGSDGQIPPPRPPTDPVTAPQSSSACEPHRAYIESQLRLQRKAMAIFQDLVDQFGFTASYCAVGIRTPKPARRSPWSG